MNEEAQIPNNDLSEQISLLVESQEQTNEQLQFIVDYISSKEEKEKKEEEQQAADLKKEEENQQKQEKQDQKQQQEMQTKSEIQEQREVTQAETIQEIHDMVDLSNHIMTGQICFLGVLLGVILMKIFWDRFHI